MKKHLHKVVVLEKNDILKFQLDSNAMVSLMDAENYVNYCEGLDYDFYGTNVNSSPFHMTAPYPGHWHIVVEQEDPKKDLLANIQIITED